MTLLWSVVVCTHNRAADLRETLSRLALLDYPADQFEIIVVDNASSDNTSDVIRSAEKAIANLHYEREERLGLSYARNKGIAGAEGKFIAFIDDDAWPEKNWLRELEKVFEDPRAACAGGMVKPSWRNLNGWPEWLHERLIGFFTVIEYPDHRDLHYPNYPAGTNIAFRKGIFAEIGGFSPALGRNGDSLLSGEESDFCLRLEEAGYRVLYTPAAVVHHEVHENRLTKDWVRQRAYWQGISSAVVERGSFRRSRIMLKSIKYSVFIFVGWPGSIIFKLIGNEKLSFFCECQVILCKAYIEEVTAAGWEKLPCSGQTPKTPRSGKS